MGFWAKLFRKKKKSRLPCDKTGECPYEYDRDSDRDVEGMPFVDGDERSCPKYGHICPEFMEEFGLTVEELNIRATIHCGGLAEHLVLNGQLDPTSPEYRGLKIRYQEITAKYPKEKFPQYYG